MTTDFSFIRLTKNDFALAKKADDPNIATLLYGGFIVQKPSETFLQISASSDNIAFAGGIQVDLIDCNGLVIRNIDANFFYQGFVDASGINQIAFEFGNIGVDYWTKQLYLKITDLVNNNVYYSNGFLITNYKTELSTRFDYFNQTKIYNISYDLAPYKQSVRFMDCYDHTPVNTREVKQYTNSNGTQVNYRSITTFLRQYYFNALDYFINDRLEVLFSHSVVYCNSERVTVSDFGIEERKGDSNWFNGEFTINKQGQTYSPEYQIYEGLEVVSLSPINGGIYTEASILPIAEYSFQLFFNKAVSLIAIPNVKVYRDGVLIIDVINEPQYGFADNELLIASLTSYATFTNGSYSIVIEPNQVFSGAEFWQGFGANEWTFEVVDGEYDNTEYNNEYLLN
jgi:hypothetical protein